MTAFMTRGAGVCIGVRTEHRLGLRGLTLVFYHSNEVLGAELPVKAVRTAVRDILENEGTNVVVTVQDYLNGEFEDGSLVGSDTAARLEWARRMILKAYRKEFERFPAELAAFEALAPEGIA